MLKRFSILGKRDGPAEAGFFQDGNCLGGLAAFLSIFLNCKKRKRARSPPRYQDDEELLALLAVNGFGRKEGIKRLKISNYEKPKPKSCSSVLLGRVPIAALHSDNFHFHGSGRLGLSHDQA